MRRPGTTVPTSAETRATSRPVTKQARCWAWQPIALITCARPLRAGSNSQRILVVCGPSSMRRGEAALDVLDLHQPERANLAVAHQARREAGHRVRRVAVRDCEQPSGRADAGDEVARLGGIVRHRLVGDDVEARVEGRDGKRVVRVVGRHDGHAVDAVGPVPFRRDHPRDIAVAPVGGHAQRGTGGAANGRGRSRRRRRRRPTTRPVARPPGASARSTNQARPQSSRAAIAVRTSRADRSSTPPRTPGSPRVAPRVCRVAYRSVRRMADRDPAPSPRGRGWPRRFPSARREDGRRSPEHRWKRLGQDPRPSTPRS